MASSTYGYEGRHPSACGSSIAASLLLIADDAAMEGNKAAAIVAIDAFMDFIDDVEMWNAADPTPGADAWFLYLQGPQRNG